MRYFSWHSLSICVCAMLTGCERDPVDRSQSDSPSSVRGLIDPVFSRVLIDEDGPDDHQAAAQSAIDVALSVEMLGVAE